jgi:hypothetical protein
MAMEWVETFPLPNIHDIYPHIKAISNLIRYSSRVSNNITNIIHHVVGLYRWSKTCYFEFFVVLFNPFWYYCTLLPCYSTVLPYYCPLLPSYSKLRPYYLPFLSCYSTLLACFSTVRSGYSILILFISL